MVFLCPILYFGWKVVWKSKIIKPEEADLVCLFYYLTLLDLASNFLKVWERPVIDAYEANVLEKHMTFWEEIKMMGGLKKKNQDPVE